MSDTQTPVPVSGIWLRTTLTGRAEVLFEREGHWWLAIDVANGNNISHIVEPGGMLKSPLDRVTETEVDEYVRSARAK